MPALPQAAGFAQAGAALDAAKKTEGTPAHSGNKNSAPAGRWPARGLFIDRLNLGGIPAIHGEVFSLAISFAGKTSEVSTKQYALEACACPRLPEEILPAPRCAVEFDTGEREAPLFVRMQAQLRCPMARRYAYGDFCLDQNRVRLYRAYGI